MGVILMFVYDGHLVQFQKSALAGRRSLSHHSDSGGNMPLTCRSA
jgi:hypothetical protein